MLDPARLSPYRSRMSISAKSCWLLGVIATVLLVGALPIEASRPFTEEERTRRPVFLRPAMDAPDEQLDYALRLREQGRFRRAQRQLRALVRTWPRSNEAVIAQKNLAQVLAERGKYRRSLEEFERLASDYPGRYPHSRVLEQLFEMAEELRTEPVSRLFFFPVNQPERAVPFLEHIIQTGPRWERAAEAQLALAELQEELGERELAVLTYERLERRHPGTPEAVTAAFRRGYVLNEISERYPRHVDGMETAYIALGLAVQQHPRDPRAAEARQIMQKLQSRMAEAAYDKAVFYDQHMRNAQAAIVTFEQFLANFPTADQAPQARERLAILQAKQERSSE